VVLAAETVHVVSQRILGRERLHRKLVVQDSDQAQREVLWWNGAEHTLPEGLIDLAFTVGWNTYQGRRSLAMTLVDLRPRSVEEVVAPAPRLELIDWRGKAVDEAILAYLAAEPDGLIWPRLCRLTHRECAPGGSSTSACSSGGFAAPLPCRAGRGNRERIPSTPLFRGSAFV
jgi:hypothetical protein